MRSSLVLLAVTGVLVSAAPVPLDLGGIAMEFASQLAPRINKDEINFERKSKLDKEEAKTAQLARIASNVAQAQAGGNPTAYQDSTGGYAPGADAAAAQARWPGQSEEYNTAFQNSKAEIAQINYNRAREVSALPETSAARGAYETQRGGAFLAAGGRGVDASNVAATSSISSWRKRAGGVAGATGGRLGPASGLGLPSSAASSAGLSTTGAGSFSDTAYPGQYGSGTVTDTLGYDISSSSAGRGAAGIPRTARGATGVA